MKDPFDPVDGALDLLRSEAWTAEPMDPKRVSKLMRENPANKPRNRFRGSTALVAALTVLTAARPALAAAAT